MFARPLGPVDRVSGLWERRVRWKNRSESGLVLFSDAGGLLVSGERDPRPGDVGAIRLGSADSLGQCPCSTSWAAKASPYWLVLCCVCRWFGVYRRGLRRDEVISWPSCRLLTCRWPVRDWGRVCAAVRHRCTACSRLRWAGHVCAASVAPRVPEGVLQFSARGGSGPPGVSHAPHEGAAEGTEDLVDKGCLRCLGFRLSADGGLQLLAHRSAWIWWIAKTGHMLVTVGVSTVRSRWGMASSCCRPSRWNLHVAVQSLVCGQRRRAHRQRQWRAWPGCQVPAAPDKMAVRGSWGWPLARGSGWSGRALFAGSMESTGSRLEWLSCGSGVIRTW